MSSVAFNIQKEVGREFEKPMMKLLEEKGFRVIDVDSWSYKLKKGRDIIVEYEGERASIEMKYDRMSEKTGRVCIDLDSLSKTESKYWIFGLPRGDQVEMYAMFSAKLKDFVREYSKNPGALKKVGEFQQYCLFVPKLVFINQPFINKFGAINLNEND